MHDINCVSSCPIYLLEFWTDEKCIYEDISQYFLVFSKWYAGDLYLWLYMIYTVPQTEVPFENYFWLKTFNLKISVVFRRFNSSIIHNKATTSLMHGHPYITLCYGCKSHPVTGARLQSTSSEVRSSPVPARKNGHEFLIEMHINRGVSEESGRSQVDKETGRWYNRHRFLLVIIVVRLHSDQKGMHGSEVMGGSGGIEFQAVIFSQFWGHRSWIKHGHGSGSGATYPKTCFRPPYHHPQQHGQQKIMGEGVKRPCCCCLVLWLARDEFMELHSIALLSHLYLIYTPRLCPK